ncbi:MAG: MotA/TolQ/ExbB proton channel family protein [Bacteriovoracaceae bacterium]|nr:MotA/TolQ/ExbB proton channel family protein [Bacteriovoracaceae bacterium]
MSRAGNILRSFMLATFIVGVSYIGLTATGTSETMAFLRRICILLGGNITGGGYIQFFTYFAFFWSLFDILSKLEKIRKEQRAFKYKLLPTDERHVLMPKDLMQIKLKIDEYEKKGNYLLNAVIKKACIKFRTSNSISEIINIINIQTDINKEKSESGQSNIRYLTWAIPSIGFIGTVLGISQALQVANSGDMNKITATLGVAFDTTLVALCLSIIVMWFFHRLQEETDTLHAKIKEYVIEHLVNRIEV